MKLLYEGGPVFTYPMTILFLVNLVLIARNLAYLYGSRFRDENSAGKWIDPVKYIGIFLLAAGILGQVIGLYSAFEVIESGKIEISPELLAGGIRVSSITTLFGLGYFLISFAGWAFLRMYMGKTMVNSQQV